VLVLVAGAFLSGCRLEIDLNVAVEEDGSGVVEVVVGLDEDAVERIGGDLEAVLEVDDLLAAGWEVDGPDLESDGYTRVRISRPFGTPEEAAEVFAQVAADDGPFQDFQVSRETSFAETRWSFTGRVDFTGGVESFGDDGLAAELDGQPLGQSVEEIEEQLGDSLSRLITVRVRARLPGEVSSNATTRADNGAVWQVGFGEEPLELRAEGAERRTSVLVLSGVAALALLGLGVLGLVRLARRVTAADEPDEAPPAHAAR
jgi:hypothetical protein